MFFPVNQTLQVKFFNEAEEAVAAGYDYNVNTKKGLRIKEAIVVRNGTVGGKATVDLILKDEEGNEYVTMITANLLSALV